MSSNDVVNSQAGVISAVAQNSENSQMSSSNSVNSQAGVISAVASNPFMNFSSTKPCPSCNVPINCNNPRYASLNLICDQCLQTFQKLDENKQSITITNKKDRSRLLLVTNHDGSVLEAATFKFALNGIDCIAIDGVFDIVCFKDDEPISANSPNGAVQICRGFQEKKNFDGDDIRVFTFPVDKIGRDILFDGKKTMRWVPARPYQSFAFRQFKANKERDLHYDTHGYEFDIKRTDQNSGIHFIRTDGSKCNIADFNGIKVFLIDHPSGVPNWYRARDYQIWAFLDFIYDNKKSKTYKSVNVPNRLPNDVVLALDIYKEDGTIDKTPYEFTIFRADNGNIYFQPVDGRRLKMSDSSNEFERYQRHIDQDYPAIAFSINSLEEQPFTCQSIGKIPSFETIDESKLNVCIVCLTNLWNVIALPCGHIQTCSKCLTVESQKHNKCPICRTVITSFAKLTRQSIENAKDMNGFRKEESLLAADDLTQVLVQAIIPLPELASAGGPSLSRTSRFARN